MPLSPLRRTLAAGGLAAGGLAALGPTTLSSAAVACPALPG
jgi:hypothetical protein